MEDRIRRLSAERARPERRGLSVEDLLARLIHVIAIGLKRPPDKKKESS